MSDPQSLWRQADAFQAKAHALRQEADALDRAAERMAAMAAAIADGRTDDLKNIALTIGHQ